MKKSRRLRKKKVKKRTKKTIKRSKKNKTRRIYYAGDNEASLSPDELHLVDVTDNDNRIVHFMRNPCTNVFFEHSPELTQIPFFYQGRHKISLHIMNCNSLVSISYRGINTIEFTYMNITSDMLRQTMEINSSVDDYCVKYNFYYCTFDTDCLFHPLSNNITIHFFQCTNIPQISTLLLSVLLLRNCKKVTFPILNTNQNLTSISVRNNEYINNDVEEEFINFIKIQRMHNVIIDTDLSIDDELILPLLSPMDIDIPDDGPIDFEVYSVNNGWIPPPPIWGNYVPTIEQCDITMDTELVDYISGNKTLRNYMNENIMTPSTVFLKCNRDYIVLDLNEIQNEINKYGIDNSVLVYECRSASDAGTYISSNVIENKPYFKLGVITSSTRSYIPLNQIEYIIEHSEHKFWESYRTNLEMISVVSHSIKSGATLVGGSHCQFGQNGRQYHIKKLIVSDEIDNFVKN